MKKLGILVIAAFALSACGGGGGSKADLKKACIQSAADSDDGQMSKEQQAAFCGCFSKSAEENLTKDQMKQLTKAFEGNTLEDEMENMEEEVMSSLKMCAMAAM